MMSLGLMMILSAPLGAAPPDATPHAQTGPSTSRFAIVVGYNLSPDKRTAPLRYADDDAVATHQLLQDAHVNSRLLVHMDEDTERLHPELVPDAPPTLDAVLSTFASVRREMIDAAATGAQTELLFFYSGHGDVEHGEGFVNLEGGRLTRSDLYERILDKSPATRNHVFIDACKSYFMVFGRGPGGERAPYNAPFVDRAGVARFFNTGFVLSTSSAQDSHEWERLQAGIFSHEVRSALRGGADADGDGEITYEELGAFLSVANAKIANARYRPSFVVRAPGKPPGDLSDAVLAWPSANDVLLVDEGPGHVYVETASGDRIADVNPKPDQVTPVYLPSLRPVFVRKADESAEIEVRDGGRVALSQLRSGPASIARKGALHVAFEVLFEQPFGMSDVASFRSVYAQEREPIDWLATEIDADVPIIERLRPAALWTAGAAITIGIGANIWAYERRHAGEKSSQLRQVRLNRTIDTLNTAAACAYGVAGLAGAGWLVMYLMSDQSGSDRPTAFVVPQHDAMTLGVVFPLSP